MSNATKNDIIILICIIVSHNNVSLLRGGTVFVSAMVMGSIPALVDD